MPRPQNPRRFDLRAEVQVDLVEIDLRRRARREPAIGIERDTPCVDARGDLLCIVLAVYAIDYLSKLLRERLIGDHRRREPVDDPAQA